MTASLYGDLLSTGVAIAYHESDLYFADTPVSWAILAHWPDNARLATRFEDQQTGDTWWDVPFAFLPWWEERTQFVREQRPDADRRKTNRLAVDSDKSCPVRVQIPPRSPLWPAAASPMRSRVVPTSKSAGHPIL